MSALLSITVEAIDAEFGEGYAKKNPDLIGRLIQADMLYDGFALLAASLVDQDYDIPDE
ncbi:hypothetical protein UFOVP35_46 [uncultured Caudovirales phage]|uniref:Uncharacterized protein n=1 Tax=uncultured Caudovirales phage TaxID=2100421 RepID=A0A6J5KN65_9CAUD|nr:hypothetical protein UFOVP35_46 [uncultured Caudovirales phage]CAB4125054.1 hypothetical protein UFOVP52_77 [uncultured Caudovirales phage]CAB5219818.1 hypothetical protein UFOVP234_25 [uncultured Caudovirales phage]